MTMTSQGPKLQKLPPNYRRRTNVESPTYVSGARPAPTRIPLFRLLSLAKSAYDSGHGRDRKSSPLRSPLQINCPVSR